MTLLQACTLYGFHSGGPSLSMDKTNPGSQMALAPITPVAKRAIYGPIPVTFAPSPQQEPNISRAEMIEEGIT